MKSGRALAETVTALVAAGKVEVVAVLVRVVDVAVERGLALVGVAKIIVDIVLLAGLLEVAVVITAEHAHVVLRAHTVESIVEAVGRVDLHTVEEVDDMLLLGSEGVVVVGRETGVPAIHLIFPDFVIASP